MEKRVSFLLIVLVVFVFSYRAKAERQADPKALFESTCSQCHSLDVPRGEKLTQEGWSAIVTRMKSNGCVITDAEAKTLIAYLAKEYGK